MSYKTCAQRKKERDRDRQRDYVGNILMDNRTLYKQMTLTGFPVSVSVAEATSGTSRRWEEEKQAYLNSEKVSLAEAINYFGADTLIDLTLTASTLEADERSHDEITIVVPQSSGLILVSELHDDKIESSTTEFEVPHEALGSHSKRVQVSTIAAEDICDIPAKGEDTQMIVDQHGYLGSFLNTLEPVRLPLPEVDGCSTVCKIPIEVLNVMVREDRKFAQRCQLIRRVLRCEHLQNLQIVEQPDAVVYDMQTLTMGKVPNERGFNYFDHFSKIRHRPPRVLSNATWHYLHTLQDPGIALRALNYTLRYSQHPGRRTTILYNWNSGAPKHELFPLRFSS